MGYRNRIYGGREASSGQMDGWDGRVQVGKAMAKAGGSSEVGVRLSLGQWPK